MRLLLVALLVAGCAAPAPVAQSPVAQPPVAQSPVAQSTELADELAVIRAELAEIKQLVQPTPGVIFPGTRDPVLARLADIEAQLEAVCDGVRDVRGAVADLANDPYIPPIQGCS